MRRVVLPPPASAAVLAVAERKEAERDEEERQEEHVAAGDGEHDDGDRYPYGKRPQHPAVLLRVAPRRTETRSALRTRDLLPIAANGLIGVTGTGEVVAR